MQASNISGLLAVPEDGCWPDFSWESGAKRWKEAVFGSSLPRVQPIREKLWWAEGHPYLVGQEGLPCRVCLGLVFPIILLSTCHLESVLYRSFCAGSEFSRHSTFSSCRPRFHSSPWSSQGGYWLLHSPASPDASLDWGLHLDHLWPLSQECIDSTCESRDRS